MSAGEEDISLQISPCNVEVSVNEGASITVIHEDTCKTLSVVQGAVVAVMQGQGPRGPQGPAGEAVPSSDVAFVYDLNGSLVSSSDDYGTKTFSYTGGKLTSIAGTGAYPSKAFSYTGDLLTAITIV